MNTTLKHICRISFGAVLGLLTCSHVTADDIEIYVGNSGGVSTKPNVLFLLDNSGSMHFNSGRSDAPIDYSSADTYTQTFAAGYYYWTTDGSIPTDSTTNNKVVTANFLCDTGITPLADNGIYTDKALAWRTGTTSAADAWRSLNPSTLGAEDIECFSDAGVHGNGGGDLYASNGATGPWSTEANAFDWDESSIYYTFYSAHYLNYNLHAPDASRTRYEVMVSVVDRLLRQISNVNIGLMWFRAQGGEGGFVDHEIVDIDNYASRESLIGVINTAQTQTVTPLSETMYEAYQYYSGGSILFGDRDGVAGDTASNESVDNSREADLITYDSPIQFECQKNYILLLTDGNPFSDSSANTLIPDLPDFATRVGTTTCDNDGFGNNGRCLDELSKYMNHDDTNLAPAVDGEHSIQTYTIGFQIDNDLLEETSEGQDFTPTLGVDDDGGGGEHFTADNVTELADAFNSILAGVTGAPSTFTAPSVSVNAFNSVLNREFLYYTMFLPASTPRWEGNLKKYRLIFNNDGTAYISDSRESVIPAPDVIDPDTAEFVDSANSYWNNTTDGADVLLSGVRDRLSDAALSNRRVWTDVGLSTSTDLSNAANQVIEGTGSPITAAMLSVDSDASRDELVQWMRGVDILDSDGDTSTTDSRRTIGDPLHSQPAIVTYGGTSNAPEQVIFISTNDGYVHAIDEATGDEIFAYIPEELLALQRTLYSNIPSINRPYGIDGSITTWVYDNNDDGIIDPLDGDHVYLYVGMRRGGNNYYALDVTNIKQTTPSAQLLWKIIDGDLVAGSQGTDTTGAYAQMGQSWSQPLVRKISIGTDQKTVLVVGGGYDTNQDLVTERTEDASGNAIYFINALTGAREWWMSDVNADLNVDAMDYSIPARLAAYDITGDGEMDRIYFGDMGGQLWRLDIDNGESVTNLVSGGVIADIAGTGEANARRFYTAPDVALAVEASGAYLGIVIGSGYRAHPLDDDIVDRLYLIKDPDVYAAPSTYTTRTEADLYDATDNAIGEESGTTLEDAQAALAAADGWYITLETPGEKSLSAPLILGGVAIMTTFTPTEINACNPNGGGEGSVYYLNLSDAQPVFNFDGVGDETNLTASDRKQTLQAGGIPSETAYIVGLNENGLTSAILHGKEQGEDLGQDSPIKTYWYEQ